MSHVPNKLTSSQKDRQTDRQDKLMYQVSNKLTSQTERHSKLTQILVSV